MLDNTNQRERAIAQVKLNKMKESLVWKETFGTEQGQKCLALLRECWYDIDFICNNDPTITQNKAAQRDLVRYIINQVEYVGEKE